MLRSAFVLSVWTFSAGVGIPLIGIFSSGMGRKLGNPFSAIVVMFAIALVIALALALPLNGIAPFGRIASAPASSYIAGLLMAFYVLSATVIIPRFGAGNFVAIILLAQLVMAAAVDHFGLFGMARQPITSIKAAAFALLLTGIALLQFGASFFARD